MSVGIQIISVTKDSLSVVIVALSRKKKYHLQDSQTVDLYTIMISLNRKRELFRLYKNEIITFEHHNSFKNISPLLYVLQKIAISRENSQSALITEGTLGRLKTV